LTPDKENSIHKTNRDPKSFRVHGDSRKNPGDASEGCIVCDKETRKLIKNTGGIITVIY
jgi:hypothetical protein